MPVPDRLPRATGFLLELPDAAPIHCRIDGRPGAPWLVFSNSHATDLTLWDEQVAAFGADYSILRYDQRGHGATPCDPVRPWTFDTLADDLAGLLAALGIENATLAGVSMGAVTALRCAARHPQRVSRVVASDGQWAAPASAAATWQARIELVEREGMGAIVKPTLARWFRPDFAERLPQACAQVARMIGDTPAAGYIGCARAMQAYDFSADYPRLALPVLYLVGAEDGLLPAVMEQMHAATPHSQFARIADAGHLPNIEQSARFNAALATFLAQHRQPQAELRKDR
ncbi:alpha/beta fold hydrolase [Massilia horti]|uniref:Alpha/beta fold hydrolase n=1 Tax=Massilia horti TaxID=2562153 RepID=A0A4Y9T7Z4_9BURK|nr:alpha/beta fold hydrolase [Massilia horti]TFW35648.1 alpha/beta fold hydrolase [Massilia horti]